MQTRLLLASLLQRASALTLRTPGQPSAPVPPHSFLLYNIADQETGAPGRCLCPAGTGLRAHDRAGVNCFVHGRQVFDGVYRSEQACGGRAGEAGTAFGWYSCQGIEEYALHKDACGLYGQMFGHCCEDVHPLNSTAMTFMAEKKPVRKMRAEEPKIGEGVRMNRSEAPVDALRPSSNMTINHLSKAGGTFIRHVFEAAVGPRLNYEEESASLSEEDVARSFVIGTVRNPLDWYVSLWAFTSSRGSCCFKKKFSAAEKEEYLAQTKGPGHVMGEDPADIERFRKWVRFVAPTHDLGLMSLRFYGSYVNRGEREAFNPGATAWQNGLPPEVLSHMHIPLADLQEQIVNFTHANNTVDCWIRTENLAEDAKSCLKEYGRVPTASVNWTAYREATKTVKHNQAKHVACRKFYDRSTIKFIKGSDANLLKFLDGLGYRSMHCSGTHKEQDEREKAAFERAAQDKIAWDAKRKRMSKLRASPVGPAAGRPVDGRAP